MSSSNNPTPPDSPAAKRPKTAVTDEIRFRRFLILGAEDGTFSQTEHELAVENAQALARLIAAGQGTQCVAELVRVSTAGLAPKPTTTIFALAMLVRLGDPATKKAAYAAVNGVLRTPTHLFAFVELCQVLATGGKGWGRAHRRAMAGWYSSKTPGHLSGLVTKYGSRGGWCHRDLLRLCHAKPGTDAHQLVFRYATKGAASLEAETAGADDAVDMAAPPAAASPELAAARVYLAAVEELKAATEPAAAGELIRAHGLVREHVPTPLLGATEVWSALLEKMPMTAMIRNLGKMSAIGLLGEGSAHEGLVVGRLTDQQALSKARIHPFAALLAKATYAQGKGFRGSLEWPVNASVSAALDSAFKLAFGAVPATGRRILQAVDCSGSMAWSQVCGSEQIDARTAAAAMAYLSASTEPHCTTVSFGTAVEPLDIAGCDGLAAVADTISRLPDRPLDLVLVLDCTGSMGSWILQAQAKLIAITEQLGAWFVGRPGDLRVGFVAYRDHNDRDQIVIAQPSADYAAVLEVVKAQSASGGGDHPEDIAGAFEATLAIEWRDAATKLAIHIADAPPHGNQYHDGCGDSYPKGDPNGRVCEDQLREMAKRGIDYVFFDVDHGGGSLDKMKEMFRSAYNGAVGRTSQEMGVTALGSESGKLERAILDVVERSAYGGGTDCAAPIRYAKDNRIPVDTFVVYTDSETEAKRVSAADELAVYRAAMGLPDAQLIVVAMTASEHTVADPDDPGMLDMVGMDGSGPAVMRSFMTGALSA